APRNQVSPYEPLPLVFGETKVAPDVISKPYTWYEGNDQYMGIVLCPGLNVHSVSDLKIGDTPLGSYDGVTVYYSGMPGHPQQDIPLWSNVDTIAGGELEPGGDWVTRTTSDDTVQIQVDLEGIL